jgi:hypothetical protein
MNLKYLILIYGVIIIFFSCKKDKPPVRPMPYDNTILGGGYSLVDTTLRLLISNEGTFNFGNASVSLYNPSNKSFILDVYKQQNNQPLGDVLQSVYILQDKVFLVVNNSMKIEVLDKQTFKRKATIAGLISPRYFLPVNAYKAYVTDLYANAISIINLDNYTKVGQIPCKGWTEQMVYYNHEVFVCNYHSNYLYVIDAINDVIVDSILISKGAQSITIDGSKNIWVGCVSSQYNGYYGALYQINPTTHTVITQYTPNNYSFSGADVTYHAPTNRLFYRNKDIFSINLNNPMFPGSLAVAVGNRNIYNFAVHPQNQLLYLCDAKDYVQSGILYTASLNSGLIIDSLMVGVIPNGVYFYKNN